MESFASGPQREDKTDQEADAADLFPKLAIAVLVLGIGANTGIFAVINALLLRPPPYAESKHLVWIGETLERNTTDQVTLSPDLLQWREENTVFTGMAAFNVGSGTFSGGSEPLQVEVAKASADLLPILEVQQFQEGTSGAKKIKPAKME